MAAGHVAFQPTTMGWRHSPTGPGQSYLSADPKQVPEVKPGLWVSTFPIDLAEPQTIYTVELRVLNCREPH